MNNKSQKIVTIGLDGGTWNLFDLLMKQGRMKNFQNLSQKGVRGTLKSSIPPTTGTAWVSFATGKSPGKHGCYDFTYPDSSLDSLKTISADRINGETVYEYLNENGKKCILINLPVSYPPRTKEITITSLLTKGDQFIFPNFLENEIPLLREYRLTPDMNLLFNHNKQKYINDIREIEQNRFACAKELFKKDWDLFFILFSGSDWIQHEMYDKLISGDLPDDHNALIFYEELDNYLKWFSENVDQNTNIIFLSDHGFDIYKGAFYINEWLRKEGYLKVKNQSSSVEKQHRINEDLSTARNKVFKTIKLPFFVRKFIQSNRVINVLATKIYKWMRDKLSLQVKVDISVDLSASVAYCTTNELNGIYINVKDRFKNGIVDRKDYQNIRSEIINRLKNDTNSNGNNIFKNIWPREEIYHGEMLNEAPDIVIELDEYITRASFPINVLEKEEVIYHHSDGIFVGIGPAFKNGEQGQNANLIDIAPTILYIMNQEIPDDMDGKVLLSTIKKEFFKDKPIRHKKQQKKSTIKNNSSQSEENEKVIERLKMLGYIG